VVLNLTAGYSRCGWGYFLFFINENYNTKHLTPLAYNVLQLGEVAEIEAQMFGLALHFIRSTDVQLTTKPAILPNCC
jgi:hypothetical protein